MNALQRPGRQRRAASAPTGAKLPSLDLRRILQALDRRSRYRYVQPRVEREGLGWKVVSPNCSRNIDAQGGDIDIAWLVPGRAGWQLYARDHAQDCWQLRQRDGSLPALLECLCADPEREFWP